MKSKIVLYVIVVCALLKINNSDAQCTTGTEFSKINPKRDLRGVFVASVYSLNWPTNRTASPAVQQAELITILNNLKLNGYNTVFLQVRSECDALYASTIEPWSQWHESWFPKEGFCFKQLGTALALPVHAPP